MSETVLDRPVCLTIGGSDSCGGAGIQADLRVFESMGVQACSATTALTAQNPARIMRVEATSLVHLDAEMHAVFDYYDVTVVKTGMLVDAERVAVVSGLLSQLHDGPLVVDPVMVSSSGRPLLDAGGVDALVHGLLPMATLLTPNLDEAAVLSGSPIDPFIQSADSVRTLADRFGCAVLLKGGHAAAADDLLDLLVEGDGEVHEYRHPQQQWSRSQRHGTGCRLASAVAAGLAWQLNLPDAVGQAVDWLQQDAGRIV